MPHLPFTHNDYPTLGVEVELQLVDASTLALTSAVDRVLAALPAELEEKVKPELMQCYLEINTDVCRTVAEVRGDLCRKLEVVEGIARNQGLRLYWAATHPFSSYRTQTITVNERYQRLVELMEDVARRLVTFGLHVHVGVDTGDKAVMVCDRMLRYLPLLLALTANSPFWEGRDTGLCSNRSIIMDGLPTAGLPHRLRNYSEYVWLVNHLIDTGFINSIREIWWDIRPHNRFGTVEVRVCDVPPDLDQVLAITAFIQCLVHAISAEIDEGTYLSEYHPMIVQQNKWRASRYGAAAPLVRSDDHRPYTVRQLAEQLVNQLEAVSRDLDCEEELHSVLELPTRTGAEQQLEIFRETQDRKAIIEQMLERNDWRRTRAAQREGVAADPGD